MFRHGFRSFSLHIVCSSEMFAANHRRGDLFGAQCRYKPSPNIPIIYACNISQKVELNLLHAAEQREPVVAGQFGDRGDLGLRNTVGVFAAITNPLAMNK